MNLEQMKYWIRKFKKISAAQPSSSKAFIPLTTTSATISSPRSPLVVQVGSARIELHHGFDTELLRQAVEALSTSC